MSISAMTSYAQTMRTYATPDVRGKSVSNTNAPAHAQKAEPMQKACLADVLCQDDLDRLDALKEQKQSLMSAFSALEGKFSQIQEHMGEDLRKDVDKTIAVGRGMFKAFNKFRDIESEINSILKKAGGTNIDGVAAEKDGTFHLQSTLGEDIQFADRIATLTSNLADCYNTTRESAKALPHEDAMASKAMKTGRKYVNRVLNWTARFAQDLKTAASTGDTFKLSA